MSSRKLTTIVTLMLLLALLAAACGGKKEATSTEVNAQPAATLPVAESALQGDAAVGEKSFQASCIACHGPDAKGVQGLGKSLHPTDSEFIRAQNDDELVEFIKGGRQPDNPANTTGIAMPPRGGNPAISDNDLYNIVAWIRTLE